GRFPARSWFDSGRRWAVSSPLASRWPPVTSALPMHSSDFLSTVPLFKSLGPPELERFAEAVREKSYPKGSLILFEDDPGDALFIVREGRVKVVLVAEDGREVILGILG